MLTCGRGWGRVRSTHRPVPLNRVMLLNCRLKRTRALGRCGRLAGVTGLFGRFIGINATRILPIPQVRVTSKPGELDSAFAVAERLGKQEAAKAVSTDSSSSSSGAAGDKAQETSGRGAGQA